MNLAEKWLKNVIEKATGNESETILSVIGVALSEMFSGELLQ